MQMLAPARSSLTHVHTAEQQASSSNTTANECPHVMCFVCLLHAFSRFITTGGCVHGMHLYPAHHSSMHQCNPWQAWHCLSLLAIKVHPETAKLHLPEPQP